MNILTILNELSSTPSKNEKLAILTREKDNELLQQVFKAAYDPTINYYIKKIPKFETMFSNPTPLNFAIENLLENIASRKITGGAAINWVSEQLTDMLTDDAEVITRIIARDLKVGCSESTANKVWKNLIPEFPYMRCDLSKKAKFDKWKWKEGVFSQLKADGMFANVDVVDENTVIITSRAGSEFDITKFGAIADMMHEYFDSKTRLNGELLVVRGGEILPRQVGNGILNKVLKGGDFAPNEHPIYMAWDMLPLDEAVPSGRIKLPYKVRFNVLNDILSQIADETGDSTITMIETRIVYSLDEAYEHYFETIAKGLEGTIVKNPEGEWFDGTSKDQVKLKVVFECDLEIVGFNDGNGRNEDTFGSIECKSSDGKLVVNVPGRGDAMRELFNSQRVEMIGKIITSESNNLTVDSRTGIYSLFLPVFLELREDKSEADSLERIIEQYESVIRPNKS